MKASFDVISYNSSNALLLELNYEPKIVLII